MKHPDEMLFLQHLGFQVGCRLMFNMMVPLGMLVTFVLPGLSHDSGPIGL